MITVFGSGCSHRRMRMTRTRRLRWRTRATSRTASSNRPVRSSRIPRRWDRWIRRKRSGRRTRSASKAIWRPMPRMRRKMPESWHGCYRCRTGSAKVTRNISRSLRSCARKFRWIWIHSITDSICTDYRCMEICRSLRRTSTARRRRLRNW